MAFDPAQIKQAQRMMWSAGNFPDVATRIESASADLVAASGIRPGQDVLDVATGTGNAAILAAQEGAKACRENTNASTSSRYGRRNDQERSVHSFGLSAPT